MIKNLIYLLLPILVFAACQKPKSMIATFYYWKTELNIDAKEAEQLDQFGADPLYIRFFDVDYDDLRGAPVPVGEMTLVAMDNISFIPVIFLTTSTFRHLFNNEIDTLAKNISRKLNAQLEDLYFAYSKSTPHNTRLNFEAWKAHFIPEIQFDCDWNNNCREAYFKFLYQYRTFYLPKGRKISCTIRLHQFKDPISTGIPPVDHGILMCYNVAPPRDTATENAVFDYEIISNYVKKDAKYPLPLDIALPVFSWGAWFRSGDFKGLLGGWNESALSDTLVYKQISRHLYQVKTDTVVNKSDYLREGDIIRLDTPTDDEIMAAIPLLKPNLRQHGRLVFFDWDDQKIREKTVFLQEVIAEFKENSVTFAW
jgi:hypothetical protein